MQVLGVDLGKVNDPSAMALVQVAAPVLHLRHLERLRLGQSYPAQVRHISRVQAAVPGAALVVDATGVGRAVYDLMQAQGLAPIGVTITAGRDVRQGDGLWHVPKRELVRALVTAFESGRIKIAASLPYAEALVRELRAFAVTIGERGHAGFEASEGHDDLVLAAALAVWWIGREGAA